MLPELNASPRVIELLNSRSESRTRSPDLQVCILFTVTHCFQCPPGQNEGHEPCSSPRLCAEASFAGVEGEGAELGSLKNDWEQPHRCLLVLPLPANPPQGPASETPLGVNVTVFCKLSSFQCFNSGLNVIHLMIFFSSWIFFFILILSKRLFSALSSLFFFCFLFFPEVFLLGSIFQIQVGSIAFKLLPSFLFSPVSVRQQSLKT